MNNVKRYKASPLCNNKYRLGEAPFYDNRTDVVSFVDIISGKFYKGNATELLSGNSKDASFDFEEYDADQMIGAAVPTEKEGEYILAATDGLYLYKDNDKCLITNLTEYFESYHRCNDAKADPKGRLFFGSSVGDDDHGTSGNLYLYDINREDKIRILQKDTKIANGMAWSKDNTKFYFSDSEFHAIFEYDYDIETGDITNRKVLFEINDGSPDGMCIDNQDNLWVAVWGGRRIECHSSATGELLAIIDVDANNVTSCCFIGESKRLFITTSGEGNDGAHDGCVFICQVDATGVNCDKAKLSSSIVFTGDIGFDKYMDGKWADDKLIDADAMEFLTSGNHLVINVEGAVSEQKQVIRPNGVAALVHTMNPEAIPFFNKIGADVWNICNNHIMDAGPEGMADTVENAAKNNVLTLGAGMNIAEAARPVIFNEAGGIGMLGVGYQRACRKADENTPGCLSWSDMETIQKSIDEIKKQCRWCVVVAHGGEEFTALPSPYTRDRYIEYLNMGADIVVSHHPHVPMNYETFKDENGKLNKAIFYSLGNFIFDTDYQRSQFNTEYGLFIKLNFTEKQFDFEPFGIKIDRENERVVKYDLPDIFTDVQADEYELLAPLAAKMFIENTKRQLRYLKPAEFANASEEDFYRNFYEPLRSGRVPGEVLDFQIVYPLAQKENEKAWEKSKLKKVVDYMLKQL